MEPNISGNYTTRRSNCRRFGPSTINKGYRGMVSSASSKWSLFFFFLLCCCCSANAASSSPLPLPPPKGRTNFWKKMQQDDTDTIGAHLFSTRGGATAPPPPTTTTTTKEEPAPGCIPLVLAVDGGTESIRACCFHAHTGTRVGAACAVPYPTHHPQPGWAEQNPMDWYENMGQAVRRVVASINDANHGNENNDPPKYKIHAICVDTTCCSVVACHAETGEPLRPSLLWMDQRAAAQCQTILATQDPALRINGNGQGPLSAEWMIPKALWLRQHEAENVWFHPHVRLCEYQDYINFKLTGHWVASACNAASRWHWNGNQASAASGAVADTNDENNNDNNNAYPGRPMSLYRALGIPELADKLPQICLPMGSLIGQGLTAEAAAHLRLPTGLPVVQGGPDAFVGMIGLGCIRQPNICLMTGSSHLHCIVTAHADKTAPGTWGPYAGAPLSGTCFAEGGQSSTGSLLRWARKLFGGEDNGDNSNHPGLSYTQLDAQAAAMPIGADGLIAIETFQGSRTPVTDPLAKGALLGLTLSHTRAHVWRALMEAVCFGTRACLEGLEAAGHDCGDEIILAGGITHSPLWLQMHADVTGKSVVVCEERDAPLLGCAALAAAGVGLQPNIEAACQAMVRVAQRWEPQAEAHAAYSRLYKQVYQPAVESVRGVSHALYNVRGGAMTEDNITTAIKEPANTNDKVSTSTIERRQSSGVVVAPSLLACDWGNIRYEVQRCIKAGAKRLHVDIFDGVYLNSPWAFTFGPNMVKVISQSLGNDSNVCLDLHMCVHDPARFVQAMAEAAPGHAFIFQWEAVDASLDNAIALARQIVKAGLVCGVSINPSTRIESIVPLLETGLVSVVDLLAVEPGFGGQEFQSHVLSKISTLRGWLEQRASSTNNDGEVEPCIQIIVDGGVNDVTAPSVLQAGADILVSGSFLFRQDLTQGMHSLLYK